MHRLRAVLAAAFFLVAPRAAYADLPAQCLPPNHPQPIMATHIIPPYPPISQRQLEQGTLLMMVTIDGGGTPVDVHLTTSSGSERLDDAAMDTIKTYWRWMPTGPKCPNGMAVKVSFTWSLRKVMDAMAKYVIYPDPSDYPLYARQNKDEGVSEIIVQISGVGLIQNLLMGASSGYPELDNAAMQVVKRHKFKTGEVDGHPTETQLYVSVPWNLQGKPADVPNH